jgi:putative FmdB family regulatory protein
MPIYKYQCISCEKSFEKITLSTRTDNSKEEIVCVHCSSVEVERVIGKTSFSLKGKGWYRDSYS